MVDMSDLIYSVLQIGQNRPLRCPHLSTDRDAEDHKPSGKKSATHLSADAMVAVKYTILDPKIVFSQLK